MPTRRAAGLRRAALLGAAVYRDRAALTFLARVRRDPLAAFFHARGGDDPYAGYERLRAAGPLPRSAIGSRYSTDHGICRQVLRSRRFGVVAESSGGSRDVDTGIDLSLLQLDPPDHTRLRGLAAPAFGPRRIAGFRPRIERTVASLLDAVPPGAGWDLIARLAAPLPIAVVTDLLGVPADDHERFRRIGDAIGVALDGLRSPLHAYRVLQAGRELEGVFERLFAQRAREPAADLVSDLVAAREEGVITPAEMVPLCTLLLVAGFETTVNLIGNAVVNLHRHPDQWRLLVDDPSLAGGAVDETLRYDPPVQLTGRFAHVDTELGGQVVPAGTRVIALLGATGRDPAVFTRPGVFDITRTPEAEHLAFSSGAHYCLGAALARLEATLALEALARRFPTLRVLAPVRMLPTLVLRGPVELLVRA